MRVKTNEATLTQINWAVAKCEGYADDEISDDWDYSIDWAEGGPIIEREKINLQCPRGFDWQADMWVDGVNDKHGHHRVGVGETPLLAAMRCYVASKLGDEFDIPEELA
jgi:hypothetical protein